MRGMVEGDPAITSHPDHVKSLFTASPDLAPSLTGESPLRPIVGSQSTLTALGERHMRQRKLLLPPFHGKAIARYEQMITEAAEREIARWPVGKPFALAPSMQAITLDVIMAGIFGIEGKPKFGTPEHGLRTATKQLVAASTWPLAQVAELMNIGRDEPVGFTKLGLELLDRPTYALISQRRKASDLDDRNDIMSLLMRARTEDGEALSDRELRDELLTLVLAGHETTANSLAWAWERLVRYPDAQAALVDAVREGDGEEQVEATITEAMRVAPRHPDDRPPRDRALAARRPRRPGRHADRDEHPAAAPPRGRLSRPVRVQARALARAQARDLRVDPVRGRHPPLPRRRAGDGRAARGDDRDGALARHRGRRSGARARRAPQRDDDPLGGRARSCHGPSLIRSP